VSRGGRCRRGVTLSASALIDTLDSGWGFGRWKLAARERGREMSSLIIDRSSDGNYHPDAVSLRHHSWKA